MANHPEGKFLTLADAAKQIGPVTTRTLVNEITRGHLPATRIGGRWLVRREDLEAYLAPSNADGAE